MLKYVFIALDVISIVLSIATIAIISLSSQAKKPINKHQEV